MNIMKRERKPVTPYGFTHVVTGYVQKEDQYWHWNKGTFENASWLEGYRVEPDDGRYIIRKAPKSIPLPPKRTWSKKLAALIVSKEKV